MMLSLYACNFLQAPIAIERMEFCQSLSVDIEGDNFVLGVALKKIKPSSGGTGDEGGSGDSSVELIKQSGKSFSSIIQQLQSRRPKIIFFGDIEMVLVSNELLKQHFGSFVDFFVRNGDFSEYTSVFAVENNAYDVLDNMQKNDRNSVDIAIKAKSIQSSMWTNPINFLQMISMLEPNTSGTIPAIQQINVGKNKEFEVSGFVVIHNTKMVGVLDKNLSMGLNAVKNRIKDGLIDLEVSYNDQKVVVGVDSITVKSCILSKDDDAKTFDIKVCVDAAITELSDNDIPADDLIQLSQDELSRIFRDVVQSCTTKSQDMKVDILGLYNAFRWNHKLKAQDLHSQWGEIYKQAQVNFLVESSIKRTHLASVE